MCASGVSVPAVGNGAGLQIGTVIERTSQEAGLPQWAHHSSATQSPHRHHPVSLPASQGGSRLSSEQRVCCECLPGLVLHPAASRQTPLSLQPLHSSLSTRKNLDVALSARGTMTSALALYMNRLVGDESRNRMQVFQCPM